MLLYIKATIIIPQNHKLVFEYFSNFINDSLWRKEVKETKIIGDKTGIGARITQYSFLSNKVPYYKNELTCTGFAANKMIVCETNTENKFWLRSTRMAEPLSENSTMITYQLEFDTAIVKYGLGFTLPGFILRFYTQKTMKQYLRVLKHILATENQCEGFITYPYYSSD